MGAQAGDSVLPLVLPELQIVRRLPSISLNVKDIRISGTWTDSDFRIQVNNRTILSLPSLKDLDSGVATVYTGSRSKLFINGPYSGGGTFNFFQSKERCVALYKNRGTAIYPSGEVYEVVAK